MIFIFSLVGLIFVASVVFVLFKNTMQNNKIEISEVKGAQEYDSLQP